MPRPGPRTTYKYSEEFKATAVRLSQIAGVAVKDVADSLYIHPFMLSLWRRQARDGKIAVKAVAVKKRDRCRAQGMPPNIIGAHKCPSHRSISGQALRCIRLRHGRSVFWHFARRMYS